MIQTDSAISLLGAKVKRLKHNWFEIEKSFIAEQNATHLILGNFSTQSNQEILQQLSLVKNYLILIDAINMKSSEPCNEAQAIGLEIRNTVKRHLTVKAPENEPIKIIRKDSIKSEEKNLLKRS